MAAPRRPKLKNHTVLALDIGSRFIKAAEMRFAKGTISLLGIAMCPTPAGVADQSQITDPKGLGKAIKELLKVSKISTRKVVVSVSGQSSVVVRPIDLPKMSLKELRQTMKFEVERHIPFSVNEVMMDYAPLVDFSEIPETEANMKVLLAAAQHELIFAYMKVLKIAGLKPVAMDVEVLATMRALLTQSNDGDEQFTQTASPTEAVAIVNIGAGSTDISVVKQEQLLFTRSVPIAGDALTEAIAEHLGRSFEEAEELKKGIGRVYLDSVLGELPPPMEAGIGTNFSFPGAADIEEAAPTGFGKDGAGLQNIFSLDDDAPASTPPAFQVGTADDTQVASPMSAGPTLDRVSTPPPIPAGPTLDSASAPPPIPTGPTLDSASTPPSIPAGPTWDIAAAPPVTNSAPAGGLTIGSSDHNDEKPDLPVFRLGDDYEEDDVAAPSVFNLDEEDDVPAHSLFNLDSTPPAAAAATAAFNLDATPPAAPTPAPDTAPPAAAASPSTAFSGPVFDLSSELEEQLPPQRQRPSEEEAPNTDNFFASLVTPDADEPATDTSTPPPTADVVMFQPTKFLDQAPAFERPDMPQDDVLQRRIYEAMLPTLVELSTEVRRSLEYFSSREPDTAVERVLIYGGTSRLPNLAPFLRHEVGVDVRTADPTVMLDLRSLRQSPEYLQELASALPVCIGLGLRDMIA